MSASLLVLHCRIHHIPMRAGHETQAPGGLRRVFFSCPVAECTAFEVVTQSPPMKQQDGQPALSRCADVMAELGRC